MCNMHDEEVEGADVEMSRICDVSTVTVYTKTHEIYMALLAQKRRTCDRAVRPVARVREQLRLA